MLHTDPTTAAATPAFLWTQPLLQRWCHSCSPFTAGCYRLYTGCAAGTTPLPRARRWATRCTATLPLRFSRPFKQLPLPAYPIRASQHFGLGSTILGSQARAHTLHSRLLIRAAFNPPTAPRHRSMAPLRGRGILGDYRATVFIVYSCAAVDAERLALPTASYHHLPAP